MLYLGLRSAQNSCVWLEGFVTNSDDIGLNSVICFISCCACYHDSLWVRVRLPHMMDHEELHDVPHRNCQQSHQNCRLDDSAHM